MTTGKTMQMLSDALAKAGTTSNVFIAMNGPRQVHYAVCMFKDVLLRNRAFTSLRRDNIIIVDGTEFRFVSANVKYVLEGLGPYPIFKDHAVEI